ncbi:DUF4124 domain-containing protein [Dokdonella fugitiva]|uniref:DUF4124 domain-containing protein n=1 Tax=Dokdonella fugitiva TaxID=328517 RepID=UPI0015F997CB|nr:DUF4124 domain-containing protein [Dokdonella fugitiva]MBA8883595.1 hypothetical protein [Dokdonella fugitiva]
MDELAHGSELLRRSARCYYRVRGFARAVRTRANGTIARVHARESYAIAPARAIVARHARRAAWSGLFGRKIMRRCLRIAPCWAALLGLMLGTPAHADPVYRCRNARGQIAYQDRACGAGEQQSEIAFDPPPTPPAASHGSARSTQDHTPKRVHAAHRPRAAVASGAATSWQCRADDGSVFYRHGRCPRTITVRGASPGARSGKAAVSVSATPLPRAEACRRLARERGRPGREHDEVVSTYERNAGRDPCR